MGDDFQIRQDIEELYKRIFDSETGQLLLTTKDEFEEFKRFIDTNFTDTTGVRGMIIDEIINSNDNIYRNLLEIIEDYNLVSEDEYTLFRGDCWTINNNFESSASITSTSENNFKVSGTFRTKQDMIGIYWYSKDIIEHPYISYGEKTDYRNVVLEFDYSTSGCVDFGDSSASHPPSLTIHKKDGSTYWIPMHRLVSNNHFTLNFNNIIITAQSHYIDANGDDIEVQSDFKLTPTDIEYLQITVIPSAYETRQDQYYEIMTNVEFYCTVSNINVTNGYICNEHLPLTPHNYRLCEGYDDIYNLNPYRLAKEMRKLGYVEWVDFYIGASHYYEKSGTTGSLINVSNFDHTRTEMMVSDWRGRLNIAFMDWLDCYSRELKTNGTDKLIISVSMENLQCPWWWRQMDSQDRYAETQWIPSTFFYSPCCDEVIDAMKEISADCLDIVTSNDLQPILQLGEAWWWWNEWDTTHGQPPCFYDAETKAKYLAEFGEDMPVYDTTDEEYDSDVMDWLNQQLVNYSDELRSVVKDTNNYTNGMYMALFFPPSVTDTDRVPPMMRQVNYLTGIYNPTKLDILQLEDYDWVTGESSHHNEVYTMGQELGFDVSNIHYYGGFVQYPEDAMKYWRLINTAMDVAFMYGFGEVFVWAGSQIRRDNKFIGKEDYELIQHIMAR